jgi:septum formation protein
MEIILASQSPYRKELLSRILSEFKTKASLNDEEEDLIKNEASDIHQLTEKLAQMKAEKVFQEFSNSLVIGSDQALGIEGQILSKPHTKERAVQQLLSMKGRPHHLVTAVSLRGPEIFIDFSNTTTLLMRELTQEEIIAYVDKDLPLDCAGSYKIESAGIALFERIETSDFTSIIGLPLIELTTNLRKLVPSVVSN